MKVSSEAGAFGGQKGKRPGEIVLAHQALEVGERLLVWLRLPEVPVHEETDRQTPKQTQHQQPIATANTAPVLVERYIQPLVTPILDPPSFAVRKKPP